MQYNAVQSNKSQNRHFEKQVACIFRVKEQTKREGSMKQNSACCLPHACSWIVCNKQSSFCCLLHAGFLLGALFETEEGDDMIL
jgi:hypothetical protein